MQTTEGLIAGLATEGELMGEGAFTLDRVMQELSDFADRALDIAIADGIAARVPGAEPAGFIALALGKHGARELNYSSDIDPILLYDPTCCRGASGTSRARPRRGWPATWCRR